MDNFFSAMLMPPQQLELTFHVKDGALLIDGLHQLGIITKEGQSVRVKIEPSLNNCVYVNFKLLEP